MNLDVEMAAWQRVVVLVGTVEQTGINTECTVRMARVLHGQPTLEGRAAPVRFDLDVPKTAGDYLLLCEWNGDTLVLGANNLHLGPIQGYWPLPSVTDPLVADLQLIVDTIPPGRVI